MSNLKLLAVMFGLITAAVGISGPTTASGDEPPAKKAGPRVELARKELAVLKQELNSLKGKKLEGSTVDRLLARVEAAEALLKPPYKLAPPDDRKKQ